MFGMLQYNGVMIAGF